MNSLMGVTPGASAGLAMEHRSGDACSIKLSGVINETFDRGAFAGGLAGSTGPLVIDMDGVRSITSFGVREWISGLKQLPSSWVGFVRCRPAIVSQFNMVSGFGGKGQVVTFYAPYHCDGCGSDFEVLVDLRKQHAAVARFEIALEKCPSCGGTAGLDDVPESYLSFVAASPPPSPPPAASAVIDGAQPAPAPFRVDKEVSGDLTALWLRGTLDKAARFKRLADGLEGKVALILSGIEGVHPEGAQSLGAFLATPGVDIYLARVPPSLLASLPPQSRLVSVELRFACGKCGTSALREVDRALVEKLSGGAEECPSCHERAFAPADAPWLRAVTAVGLVPPPPALQRYLQDHPKGPGSAVEAASGAKTLGKYELVSRIGIGGMAEIFLARQVGPEGFEKKVALKRILPQLAADRQFVEMFFSEARIAAKVSHPNVVQIFDLGQDRNQHYIAMEYVRGPDLNTILRTCRDQGRQIPVELACRIIGDVCAGLHAAHSLVDDEGRPVEIIHRDVSPHNVLISMDGSVKITDFGIARAVHSIHSTRPGTLKGKICYMAPEQVDGDRPVDARADIFATAIVLYQCLTQEQVFRRDSEVETLMAVVNAPIPKPSSRRPDVPEALDAVLARGLARKVDLRFPTAQAFQLALEDVIAGLGRPATSAHLSAWLKEVGGRAGGDGLVHDPSPLTPSRNSGRYPWEVNDHVSAPVDEPSLPTSPTAPAQVAKDPEEA